jgi:hypothetical protein
MLAKRSILGHVLEPCCERHSGRWISHSVDHPAHLVQQGLQAIARTAPDPVRFVDSVDAVLCSLR